MLITRALVLYDRLSMWLSIGKYEKYNVYYSKFNYNELLEINNGKF